MSELHVDVHPEDPLHQSSGPTMAWSLGNTSEALPGILTPLGWTFWRTHLNVAIRRAYFRLGALPRRELVADPDPLKNFGAAFYGRYTASIELGRRMADLLPGTSAASFDRSIFGSVQPGTPHRSTRRRYPIVAWRLPVQLAVVRRRALRNGERVRRWWEQAAFLARPWPAGLAQQRIREAGAHFDSVMADHTISTYLAQRAVTALRVSVGDAPAVELDDLMVSGTGDVVEGAMLEDTRALAEGRLGVAEFLRRHGFYGPRGGAIDVPSWREDPAALDSYCAALLKAGGSGSSRDVMTRRAERSKAAEVRFLRAVPRRRRPRARMAISLCRKFVPFREVGKASFLQVLDVLRAAAHDLGAHLCEQGLIAFPEDVFYLTENELLGDRLRADAKDVIALRRSRREHYLKCDLPRLWTGDPEPVPAQREEGSSAEDRLRDGAGVSVGVAQGRVRVVVSPDLDDFEPDEILVCVSTDPAWAPLFSLAGGLVTELGGALSHGAIIARELGLPAVVNVAGATSWLRDGDVVRVDGASGTVSVIARA